MGLLNSFPPQPSNNGRTSVAFSAARSATDFAPPQAAFLLFGGSLISARQYQFTATFSPSRLKHRPKLS